MKTHQCSNENFWKNEPKYHKKSEIWNISRWKDPLRTQRRNFHKFYLETCLKMFDFRNQSHEVTIIMSVKTKTCFYQSFCYEDLERNVLARTQEHFCSVWCWFCFPGGCWWKDRRLAPWKGQTVKTWGGKHIWNTSPGLLYLWGVQGYCKKNKIKVEIGIPVSLMVSQHQTDSKERFHF